MSAHMLLPSQKSHTYQKSLTAAGLDSKPGHAASQINGAAEASTSQTPDSFGGRGRGRGGQKVGQHCAVHTVTKHDQAHDSGS